MGSGGGASGVGYEVEALELDGARVLLLLGGVVVVGQAVDPDYLVSARGELLGEMRADEAGGSGDGVPHPPNGIGSVRVRRRVEPTTRRRNLFEPQLPPRATASSNVWMNG